MSRTIAIDFDGVIHGYESGWTGPVPNDAPVPGAREAIAAIRELGFAVHVFSCRALTLEGRRSTKAWLTKHGIVVDHVTGVKPHAQLYIDDRGWRFEGCWADVIAALTPVRRPWNADRQPAVPVALEAAMPTCGTCGGEVAIVREDGTYETCGHPIPDVAELDAQASREDEARFRGWSNRITDLDDFDIHVDGPRLDLICEIHEDIARRHPLGIARQLSNVLDALACYGSHEDEEAVELLDDLADTEKRSREMNGRAP